MEKLKEFMSALQAIPRDIHALILLGVGAALACVGHKDEGMLVIGGALAVFKGDKQP